MEKTVGFIEMLKIEKEILRVYDELIEYSGNKDKKYLEKINYLVVLLDIENEQFEKFITSTDIDLLNRFVNETKNKPKDKIQVNRYDESILDSKTLYKHRLAESIRFALNNGYPNIDMNDYTLELSLRYIWNIEKAKAENNTEKINKIQYYNCFLNRRVERFFLDNLFDFRAYLLHITTMSVDEEIEPSYNYDEYDDEDFDDVYCRSANMWNEKINTATDQLKLVLDELQNAEKGSMEYICKKSFIKSITQIVDESYFRNYYESLKDQEEPKYLLIQEILKSK